MTYNVFSGTLNPAQSVIRGVTTPDPTPIAGDTCTILACDRHTGSLHGTVAYNALCTCFVIKN